MKREEAGGEPAVISSVPTSHLPTTPLPAPQTQPSPDFLPCPGAKIPFSWVAQWAGICRQGCWRELCREDNAACLFATARMAVLRRKKKSEVLLHIQSPHLLIK